MRESVIMWRRIAGAIDFGAAGAVHRAESSLSLGRGRGIEEAS